MHFRTWALFVHRWFTEWWGWKPLEARMNTANIVASERNCASSQRIEQSKSSLETRREKHARSASIFPALTRWARLWRAYGACGCYRTGWVE
jgi:hypothetical protein